MKLFLLLLLVFFIFSSNLYSQSREDLNSKGSEYYKNGEYKNALIYFEKGVSQAEIDYGKKK